MIAPLRQSIVKDLSTNVNLQHFPVHTTQRQPVDRLRAEVGHLISQLPRKRLHSQHLPLQAEMAVALPQRPQPLSRPLPLPLGKTPEPAMKTPPGALEGKSPLPAVQEDLPAADGKPRMTWGMNSWAASNSIPGKRRPYGDNGPMTQDAPNSAADPADDLDTLEAQLDEADAADAPDVAEKIARRLGDSLDGVAGGSGSSGL